MKKRHLFIAATALLAFASSADDGFVGDENAKNGANNGAIQFVSSTPTLTRAGGATAAEKLDYKFKVYGVKKTSTTYTNVFAGEVFSSAADYNASTNAYWVWYEASTAGATSSNTSNWDYVGGTGTHGTLSHEATLTAAQTIKYWDYGADQYEFVAYSATEGAPTISKYQKDGFTVVATPAQLAGLYIADKLTINTKNNTPTKPASGTNQIGNIVQFTFRAAGAKVRLGIYETIPGYVVQNVKFRPNATEFDATTANAKLSGSFNGTSSTTSGTFNVTYNETTGVAEFDATASASNYFDFGTFASATPTAIGETSITPMWASGSADYQNVLPNTDNVGNMILYVDYDLYNATTGETIHVKGAKAVVPSMYMKWNPNYAYTYLFKISDNTNGTTGTEGTSPEGIFPITFDALTVAVTDGQEVGTITTVSTPAITTYQNGSVSAAGITYAHANGPIYITVNTDGTVETLTDKIKLYTVEEGTTEADLILTTKTKTEVTTGTHVLSILAADEKVQDITFTTAKAAKFIPNASTNYAVRFKVSAGSATATTADYNAETTYYSMTPDADGFYTVVNPIPSEDLNAGGDAWKDATAQAKYTTAPTQPVYVYKVIKVVAE